MKVLSKQVFEIRFKENPTLMDFRGLWTKDIAAKLNFRDWKIDATELTVIDKPSKTAVFLSYQRLGGLVVGKDLDPGLPELSEKYMEILYDLDKFSMPPVRRIGVRCQYLITTDMIFPKLRESFNNALLRDWQNLEASIGADIDNAGIILELTGNQFDFKVHMGPMEKQQMLQFVPDFDENELPDVAFCMDLDTKKEDIAHTDRKTLSSLIARYFANNEAQMQTFCELVGVHSDAQEEVKKTEVS